MWRTLLHVFKAFCTITIYNLDIKEMKEHYLEKEGDGRRRNKVQIKSDEEKVRQA
jgi:hypothetical protein